MFKKIALISLVIVLGLVNWSIAGKEKHLAEGQLAFLDLAPVDPRSLMQGDYMALRFRLANEVRNAVIKTDEQRRTSGSSDGFVVVSLDTQNIASFKSIYDGQAITDGDILMRYRIRNGVVKLATNAFFFQEGKADVYQAARYGAFRIDDEGELLLVSMHDKDLNKLGLVRSE